MKSIEEITVKVNLPPVTQIGVVVRDVNQAVEYYSKNFGLGPFTPAFDFTPEKNWYMGKKLPMRLRQSKARWGSVEFELVQPLEGKSIHQDFLDAQGEGLHHLGIDIDTVENYEEVVQRMKQAGFKPLQAIEIFLARADRWAKATFFDTHKIGGVITEVMWRPR